MPDRLLHQGAQPGLATVVGAFGGGALIVGAPVAGRRVPVRPSLGQPSKPSVDQGGDLGIIQDLVDPERVSSSCSWQLPGQPPSHHSRSPWMADTATPWAVWVWRLAS